MPVMKIFLALFVLSTVFTTGCASQSWYCQSDIASVANACTTAQMAVMRSLPQECPHGADGQGRIYAESREGGLVRHGSEASMECRVSDTSAVR